MKLYDGARKILNTLIVEYRKEDMTDADIADCLDFTKKILYRIPIITENTKVTLGKALDDTKAELEGKKK
jgi:arsenate reductase-like glutaredoxin family protein